MAFLTTGIFFAGGGPSSINSSGSLQNNKITVKKNVNNAREKKGRGRGGRKRSKNDAIEINWCQRKLESISNCVSRNSQTFFSFAFHKEVEIPIRRSSRGLKVA